MRTNNKVTISIRGGAVYNIKKPDDVAVEIRDYDAARYGVDCMTETGTDGAGDEYTIDKFPAKRKKGR
jgi:hypothetical protein